MLIPERVYERVLHWADRTSDGCLASRYSVGSHGYAQIGWHEDGKRTVTLCHRVVWRYLEGEIPEGLTVDHICKNKRCVERAHLRLLSNFENARRTSGKDWPLGQCINGHSNEFLRTEPHGRTRCTKCKVDTQRRYREKKRLRSQPPSDL